MSRPARASVEFALTAFSQQDWSALEKRDAQIAEWTRAAAARYEQLRAK